MLSFYLPLLFLVAVACSQSNLAPSVAQSPINLFATAYKNFPPFNFDGIYAARTVANVKNTGHELKINLPPGITIGGGGLRGTYKVVQAHLHWDKRGMGSEHAIWGQKFPAELHVVCIQMAYNNLSMAISDGGSEAIAVFGFFVKEGMSNPLINAMLTANPNIQDYDVMNHIPSLSVSYSLDRVVYSGQDDWYDHFFRYKGSLTTTPFTEKVVWTMFLHPMQISHAELELLRNVTGPNSTYVAPNYRPIQSRNHRDIFASSDKVLEEQQYYLKDMHHGDNHDDDDYQDDHSMSHHKGDGAIKRSTFTIAFCILAVVTLISVVGAIVLAVAVRKSLNDK